MYREVLQEGQQTKLNPADERSVRTESEAKELKQNYQIITQRGREKKFQVPKIREQKENIKANIIRIQKINREYF